MSHFQAGWFDDGLVRFIWYLAAVSLVALDVVVEGAKSILDGDLFNEFTLMTIAAIGAFAIGEYAEGTAVMLFYCIGEMLQDRAVDRARSNIKSLVAFRPEFARVDGRKISPEEVKVGDIIEVQPGERVPLDGENISGDACFNTAALTGESVPRMIRQGDEVMAGVISSDSIVRLKVLRPASESAVSRILKMVEDATERKAPAELFIRRFSRIYTPVVCLLALLLVLVPWILSLCGVTGSYDFGMWLHRALIFLVISCPCALVISVPLGYFAGIGAASKRGILFKGSNYLDAIADVGMVVFDKTGTLTTGEFHVEECIGLGESDIQAVAGIERSSSHPIAQAVVAYAEQSSGGGEKAPAAIKNLKNIAGYGLSAEAGGSVFLVGATRLLRKENISYPEDIDTKAETIVAVAKDGRYAGYLSLADTLKDDSREAVGELGREGVGAMILSGDRQELVDKIAKELGVRQGFGDLLPDDKVEKVSRLEEKKAFVGDGINDAPVLAVADVGIAMGGMGSDMAIETADVVIQTDQPSRVAEAVAIGRTTRKVVRENIIFAIAVKVIIMILGALGLANMWAAVFADVGVALICIVSSLRVMRWNK